MTKKSASSSGIGFGGLLCLLFIGLKLTHFIDWSWRWVLSPFWIPLALIAVVLCSIGFFVFVCAAFAALASFKK